ncbi:MAG TPA: MASE1 domain-containing protein [Actinomycetota bacterium]|nr:MASE1 domain-containing protein [Actinomycetota bacterium]
MNKQLTAEGVNPGAPVGPYVRTAGRILAVAAAYFVAAGLGLLWPVGNAAVNPLWMPTGVSVALLFLWGRGCWVGIVLGALAAGIVRSTSPDVSLGIAAGNILEALLIVWLLRRFVALRPSLDRVRDVIGLLVAVLVGCLPSAVIGAATGLGDAPPGGGGLRVFGAWYLGNVVGGVIVAALIFLVADSARQRWKVSGWRVAEASTMLLAITGLSWWAFFHHPHLFPITVVLPLVVVLAIRLGSLGAIVGSSIMAVVATWAVLSDAGPYPATGLRSAVAWLQVGLLSMTVTALLLAAVLAERRRAEIRARRREWQLAEAQSVSGVGSWEWDIPSGAVEWSEECYRIHGVDRATFVPTYDSFMALVVPADRPHVEANIAIAMKTDEFSIEYTVNKPGGATAIVEGKARVFRDARGAPIRLVGVAFDVTEARRQERERENVRAQLEQAQKMEAIGQLAGGVAHDFNNLLSVILNYASFVAGELDRDDPRRADVDEIVEAAKRGAALTRQLLTFSRREVKQPEVLNLNDVVAGLSRMLRRTIRESIELSTRLAQDAGQVRVDPGHAEQIVLNLVINARDAMPSGGKLLIETANESVDAARGDVCGELAPGDYVRLSVTDTGHGMPDEVRARVFEPFFTTKGVGEGTGLGLATVYGIVNEAGGGVAVRSEEGAGSTFDVYLPRSEEPAGGEEGAPGPSASGRPRGGVVLVAEDERAVRELVARILTRAGFEVLPAADGAEALEVYGRSGGNVDLLLTDVIMPGLSGRDLANRLGIRTVFMSGYTDKVAAEHGFVPDDDVFVQKPFTAQVLLEAVEEALDRAAQPSSTARAG